MARFPKRPRDIWIILSQSGYGPKPYEFIGKLAIHRPKPYEFVGKTDIATLAQYYPNFPWPLRKSSLCTSPEGQPR